MVWTQIRSFILLACLLFCSVRASCQFHGGTSDGHANVRMTNVTCVLVNVNPFKGGLAGGSSRVRLTNVSCTIINVNPFRGGSNGGTATAVLTNVSCTVVNANPFRGGQGDGHDHLQLTNVNCFGTNANPFHGGSGSGDAVTVLTNVTCVTVNANPFLGGQGTGDAAQALINVICIPVNVNPFLGGAGTGDNSILLTNTTCIPVNVNPFLGGVEDGHATASMINIICPVININPYLGGISDGHSNIGIQNVICTPVNVNPFAGGIATGFSAIGITNILCTVTSLPIELTYFNAKAGDGKVYLDWQTATEINNDYFTVERSKEGSLYEQIQNIKSAGNSSVTAYYNTTDNSPYPGTSYYRLRQTDYDGKSSLSDAIKIMFNRNGETSIWPNPATGDEDIVLTYFASREEKVVVNITDAMGITIYTCILTSTADENTHLFKATAFKSGLYFMNLKSKAGNEVIKFLVSR